MPNGDVILVQHEPAEYWRDAFPLGNGSIGAMHFGGVALDRIQFSEGSFWSGEASAENVEAGSPEKIAEIRELLTSEKFADAEKLAQSIIGRKLNYGTNLPFGDIVIEDLNKPLIPSSYKRSLDLRCAISSIEYQAGDGRFLREVFVSHPDQVMAIRLHCERPGQVNSRVAVEFGPRTAEVKVVDSKTIEYRCRAFEDVHSDGKTGVSGAVTIKAIVQNGEVSAHEKSIVVKDADEVVFLLAAATDFTGDDPLTTSRSRIDRAASAGYERLKSRHIEDHSTLFDRVEFYLEDSPVPDGSIAERVQAVCSGKDDPDLYALLFQFGRYLLIGSSRPDSTLPAHLTGVWNDNIACNIGWTCDYHLDINTQMNYWLAETTNLGECHEPLFRWISERLVPSGRLTARELYDCEGWVAHIVSNAWGFSAPGWSTHWGFFPTGGVWIASHLWYHYEFTRDRQFLQRAAYPVLRESAAFFLDHLFEHPNKGWLVSGPSCDPETAFLWQDDRCPLSLSPTVDRVLVYELFSNCIQASEILDIDTDFRGRLLSAREKLPPYQINSAGELQEWLDDVENAAPGHRHTSHLLGLYPYDHITPVDTPDLAAAARSALSSRLNAGGGYEEGSWARNNVTLFFARLGDSTAAHQSLLTFMRKGGVKSLMTAGRNDPSSAYEMDYNTGVTAGIAEMLLQSHRNRIYLLPALPAAWPRGRITGLCARGGFEIDISWTDRRLLQARIVSNVGGLCRLKSDVSVAVTRSGAEIATESAADHTIEWITEAGQEFLITAI